MDVTWNDIDLLELREQRGETIFVKSNQCKNNSAIEVQARYGGQVRRHEDTYLIYKYTHEDTTYLFGWVTPYDELERAYAQGDEITEEWYDRIHEGDLFTVMLDSKRPWCHAINDATFGVMSGGVYYFGSRNA